MFTQMANPVVDLQDANIVCDGNSITAGGYPPSLLNNTFIQEKNCTVKNFAVSGQHTEQMQDDAVDEIDSQISVTRLNILIAWEITNDIFFGRTAQEAYDRFKQYCLDRKAAGWRILTLSCLDREQGSAGGLTPTEYSEELIQANLLTSMHWQEYCDQYVDVRKIPQFKVVDRTFLPDGVHPNSAGNALITKAILPALKRIPKH